MVKGRGFIWPLRGLGGGRRLHLRRVVTPPYCPRARVLPVLKPKFKRVFAAVTVLLAAALSAAAPASYAACVAMATRPAASNCPMQSEHAPSSSMQMRMDCLAQLHSLNSCVASQSSAVSGPVFHFVALALPPPLVIAPAFFPRLRLTKPPPLFSRVPLTIRYSVFLK